MLVKNKNGSFDFSRHYRHAVEREAFSAYLAYFDCFCCMQSSSKTELKSLLRPCKFYDNALATPQLGG